MAKSKAGQALANYWAGSIGESVKRKNTAVDRQKGAKGPIILRGRKKYLKRKGR